MKQILCLATESWSATPRRTQQLISRLRDVQILYFSPAEHWRDHSFRQKGRKVRPNITAYTLPPVYVPDGERFLPFFRANQKRVAKFIRDKAAQHRFQSPLLWTTCPDQIHLLDHLDYENLVYDCGKQWDEFPPEWEGGLAHVADVVFAASPTLVQSLSPCSINVALIPNGVTYPLFSGLNPAPTNKKHNPIFGWVGTIRPALDLAPVLYAAQSHPDWNFILVGTQQENPLLPRLARLPNVLLPGPCTLDQIPEWLARCDVLLDLLHTDRPDDGVVTTRLYEYLSTGKPIVSMQWPDQVEQFPDVVYAAHSNGEFLHLCDQARNEDPNFVSHRRRRYGANANWSSRTDEITQILTTCGLL